METTIQIIHEIYRLAQRDHFHCDEDCFYSCPMHPECCNNQPKTCTCGADKHNAKLEALMLDLDNAMSVRVLNRGQRYRALGYTVTVDGAPATINAEGIVQWQRALGSLDYDPNHDLKHEHWSIAGGITIWYVDGKKIKFTPPPPQNHENPAQHYRKP